MEAKELASAKRLFDAGRETAYNLGKQDGRQEVVEWIKEQQYECTNPEDMVYHWILIPPKDWQAQLEVWGL